MSLSLRFFCLWHCYEAYRESDRSVVDSFLSGPLNKPSIFSIIQKFSEHHYQVVSSCLCVCVYTASCILYVYARPCTVHVHFFQRMNLCVEASQARSVCSGG